VPYSRSDGFKGSTTTTQVVNHICFCYSYKGRSIAMRNVLSIWVSVNIYIQSIWLQMVLVHIERSTWSCQLGEQRDAMEGLNWMNTKIHFKAMIEWCVKCTYCPSTSEFRRSLHTGIHIILVMYWHATIAWNEKYTWRKLSSEVEKGLIGQDQVNLLNCMEAMIERVRRYDWKP